MFKMFSTAVTRLRVPTLLSENPGDTGVARRVKRAYSSLDTLGIRVGVFLRRYPLARILVILYMVRIKSKGPLFSIIDSLFYNFITSSMNLLTISL